MNTVPLSHIINVAKDAYLRIEVEYNPKEDSVVQTLDFSLNIGEKTKVSFDLGTTLDAVFHLLEMPKIDFESVVDKVNWEEIYREEEKKY